MRRADPEADEIEVNVRLIVARVGKRTDEDIRLAVAHAVEERLVGEPVHLDVISWGESPGPPGIVVDAGVISGGPSNGGR